jgi:peroxiredoxin
MIAPVFTLPDTDRRPVTVDAAASGKTTVLVFFPGAYTTTCTKELCTFRDDLATYNALNAQIYAISVDTPFTQKKFAADNGLTFPLLSDFNKEVGKLFGVQYEEWLGLRGVEKRSVFVIDRTGRVRYTWVSEDASVLPPFGEVKKAVEEASRERP